MKTMEQLTAAQTGKVLQELRNLYLHLKQNNRTMDEFVEYMKGLDLQSREVKRLFSFKCIKCGSSMNLHTVNTRPNIQVGGDYKSQWYCPRCGYYILSINTPRLEWKLAKEKS